jgi:hypothetical protein
MLQYDPSIFDGVILPDGIDPNIVKDDIIEKCGDLYPYYQVPPRVKLAITRFFAEYYHNFEMMYKALTNEYNPIENTDWSENSQRKIKSKDNGTDNRVIEGGTTASTSNSQTTNNSGTNTNVSDFESNPASYAESTVYTNAYNEGVGTERDRTKTQQGGQDKSKTTNTETLGTNTVVSGSGSETQATSSSDVLNYNKNNDTTDDFEIRRHGNIGVQTTSQIINMELEMRRTNLYNTITDLFEDRICVQVY